MKKGFSRIAFEFMSIVIAVLLALFLTESRQNYLNKQQAKKTFRAIQNEVSDNLELIRLDSVDHLGKLEKVNLWLSADEDYRDTVHFDLEIIHSLTKSTAWEVAKLNQMILHMPEEAVMAISRVYTMQQFYDQNGRDMYGQMTDIVKGVKGSDTIEGAITAFGYELVKETTSVTTLKQTYEEFLAKYPIESAD